MQYFNLTGQTAVVTGAGRGLGQAMAVGLAEAGADVALLQRSSAGLETRERIQALGRRCEIVPCDLSDMQQVKGALNQVDALFGKIDILVNNGGIQRRAPAVDFSEQDWDDVLDVNLKSVFLLCQEAGRRMIRGGRGKIINIASLLSFQGGITVPAYAAAKGGVMQLTKALSNEWAGLGINVNAIAPGYMDTDMNTALKHNETRSRQIMERIPAERWGRAEDMVGAVIYLASPASDYVHGHVLAVDGGWLGR
ncbi:2-dehydro-3-deoxy-D-gluconate 5-dehydrogenase KduD [Paenibacillus filicis]|uniref:2-dehydro-3-deoxy-D-gluconate 5-dehydrogenase KduD n=1 Tax=Paenibacillus gyeongsangnamensis TaxID=3388067 RepID=A0ABT4QF96_9BACL|nr:2-dehydro-3-deoxy-D-gluconate 5-dehydrogenase KduD [Paenibacillus filicis]MCZ8515421.1 2-dehydro-3-deoxy-D-gluconate 5-dehydrogenase KduD [Paenibacillus filicis]